MFSTRSLTADLVQLADVPACLSTAGADGSHYLAANAGYLRLVERVWNELQNKDLLAAGTALSSSQRDRRLWLLETNGYYDAEPAEVRSATGRIVNVEISSQRVWCSGVACDLEYFMPLSAPKPRDDVAGSGSAAPRRAAFTPRFSGSLRTMSLLDRRIMIGRIMSLAAEGAVLARNLADTPETGETLTTLVQRLTAFQVANRASPTTVGFDFSDLDYEEIEDLLLRFTGDIWSLIMAGGDRVIADTLRCLVAKYTMPRPVLVDW
jgi:hypothetical protein